MSWEVISCWIEGHPGLASWVQAVGSVIALLFAVLLPYLGRRADRKQADDKRVALLIVLFTDAELIICSCDSQKSFAQQKTGLDALVSRLNVFLSGENSLLVARSALRVRSEIEKFRIALNDDWTKIFLDVHADPVLRAIREETVTLIEPKPHLLKPLRPGKSTQ